MKKIIFELSKNLAGRLDAAVEKEGYNSRSELLRFLIVNYLKKEHPHITHSESPVITEKPDQESPKNKLKNEFADVDCTFGIPANVIERIWQLSKEQ